MTGLWNTWLKVWCWGVMAFGVVLALIAVPATHQLVKVMLSPLVTDPAAYAALDQSYMTFAFGLQGALTIGWAMTMFITIEAANVLGARVWRSLTLSLLAWYVIDSAISATNGFPLNAVSNTALVAAYLIPVLAAGFLRDRNDQRLTA